MKNKNDKNDKSNISPIFVVQFNVKELLWVSIIVATSLLDTVSLAIKRLDFLFITPWQYCLLEVPLKFGAHSL